MGNNLVDFMKSLEKQALNISKVENENKNNETTVVEKEKVVEHEQVEAKIPYEESKVQDKIIEKIVEQPKPKKLKLKLNKKEEIKEEVVKEKQIKPPEIKKTLTQRPAEELVELNIKNEEKPLLNAAGREIKIFSSKKSEKNHKTYPVFSKFKNYYDETDLENPELTDEQRKFIINRIEEQKIEEELNQVIIKNKDRIPTYKKKPQEEDKTTYGKIQSKIINNINKSNQNEVKQLDGYELDDLFKKSASNLNYKERWIEIYNKAWESNSKTISNKKFKKGKFRLDENGILEILPDFDTYNKSSKDLLGEAWEI